MGLFATGVAVLATFTPQGEPIGMTANAITSVSLEPMLLLVCVDKRARIAPHILSYPAFSLSFLHEQQAPLSDLFAGRWKGAPLDFHFESWGDTLRLAGCIAAVGCRRYQVLEGGDHWIIIGEVTALYRPEGTPAPLIFYSGQYRSLAPLEGDSE
jgi:flavin reductase (DIM6/NTAB) family NADH-FMN oxidoreductase RutF